MFHKSKFKKVSVVTEEHEGDYTHKTTYSVEGNFSNMDAAIFLHDLKAVSQHAPCYEREPQEIDSVTVYKTEVKAAAPVKTSEQAQSAKTKTPEHGTYDYEDITGQGMPPVYGVGGTAGADTHEAYAHRLYSKQECAAFAQRLYEAHTQPVNVTEPTAPTHERSERLHKMLREEHVRCAKHFKTSGTLVCEVLPDGAVHTRFCYLIDGRLCSAAAQPGTETFIVSGELPVLKYRPSGAQATFESETLPNDTLRSRFSFVSEGVRYSADAQHCSETFPDSQKAVGRLYFECAGKHFHVALCDCVREFPLPDVATDGYFFAYDSAQQGADKTVSAVVQSGADQTDAANTDYVAGMTKTDEALSACMEDIYTASMSDLAQKVKEFQDKQDEIFFIHGAG